MPTTSKKATKPQAKPAPRKAPPAGLAVAKKATRALVKEGRGGSAADQRRAEDLLAQIARRKLVIAEEFYDIGIALRELQKKKLFAPLGYASFAAMLEARDVMSLSQAYKLIRIVDSLPREKALSVGSEKAALLIGYADATPETDNAESALDTAKLPSGKSIARASTRELTDAVKKARTAAQKKRPGPEESRARASAKRAQAALRKLGAKGATVTAIRKAGAFWLRVELPENAVGLLTR